MPTPRPPRGRGIGRRRGAADDPPHAKQGVGSAEVVTGRSAPRAFRRFGPAESPMDSMHLLAGAVAATTDAYRQGFRDAQDELKRRLARIPTEQAPADYAAAVLAVVSAWLQ